MRSLPLPFLGRFGAGANLDLTHHSASVSGSPILEIVTYGDIVAGSHPEEKRDCLAENAATIAQDGSDHDATTEWTPYVQSCSPRFHTALPHCRIRKNSCGLSVMSLVYGEVTFVTSL